MNIKIEIKRCGYGDYKLIYEITEQEIAAGGIDFAAGYISDQIKRIGFGPQRSTPEHPTEGKE